MAIKGAKELVAEANLHIETLSADEAVQLMNDPTVVFVYVREADERRKTGTLRGTVHASRGFLEFHADPNSPTHVKELSGAKKLVLFCASGNRSALPARTLKSMGLEKVAHVAGGFGALQKARGATENLT